MKDFLLLVFICIAGSSLGQEREQTFSIKGIVIDSLEKKPIPFVSISKKRDGKGTRSDFEGQFTLDNVRIGDSITLYYIGYEKRILHIDHEVLNDTFYLSREVQQLDEVIVLADNSILFDLIFKSQKTASTKSHLAKTYFELETFSENRQLELFQGYYNGSFQAYNVVDLKMKNARFALAPISKRIFASTESSKAMYLHQLMQSNDYFPISPFELNRRQLKKTYKLALNSKYQDENNKTIYVIRFEPKQISNNHFSGNVWIDSASCSIHKVKLQINNSEFYPFVSIWPIHSLNQVDMELTKSFQNYQGDMVMTSTDFNYNLKYVSEDDSVITISSRAVLYPYNYDESFLLPFFNFTETSNSDYRRIQMLPYNNAFWQCEDEFKLENNANKNSFINEQATIKAYQLFSSDTLFEKNFFENPYVTWNGNRIIIKGLNADSSKYYDERRTLYADRYKLTVQLFVDINDLCDSTQIITKTIFDPYDSYFLFETTKESQVFLNIYFDLMEIERRKLADKLEGCKNDSKAIKLTYNDAVEQSIKLSQEYFREVQRGTDKEALKKWNKLIIKELGIDNISLFGIE